MSAGRRARARAYVKARWAEWYPGLALWQEADPVDYDEKLAREVEMLATFAATEVQRAEGAMFTRLTARLAAAEGERDEARREAETWKMQAYDHGYQP